MNLRHASRPTRLMLALAAALPAIAWAAPPSTSAYATDKQSSYVQDSTSEGVDQVNMITCIISSMKADALVNQPTYVALVDKNKCDNKARASTSNSTGDSGGNTSYMTALVNSSRASNSDPMRVKAWLDNKEENQSTTIYANVSVTEAPTDTNPYGAFRLDYCGIPDGSSACMMQGYLQGAADGINYFETGQGGGGSRTAALRLTTNGTASGAGMLQISEGTQGMAFTFAYNADYFLRHTDGIGDQCFARDATVAGTGMSVWRYGLYTADTGDRVERHSNFPIEYTAADGKTYHGNMGYYGLWVEDNQSVPNGATVQRVEYVQGQEPTRTPYTVVEAPGRLMKYTKQTRTLASLDKIHFQTWVSDATNFFTGAQSNQQYEMYWDDAAATFKVVGMVVCQNGPCETQNLASEQSVSPSFFTPMGGMHGWSQSLGGELFIPLTPGTQVVSTGINAVYRKQDLVYPADMPAQLYCLNNCPTAATIAGYFTQNTLSSPYVASTFNNWMPVDAAGVVSYTADKSAGMLVDGAQQPVSFNDASAAQQHPQYGNGVMTGRLFDTLAAAACDGNPSQYCSWKVEQMDVYYQWQTGPNQWNQFAALKDSNNQLVTFDPPLQVNYTVPSGAMYGEYANKSIVLQYGGFGDLWGIPGHCVSHETNEPESCQTTNARYVPAFAIPFDDVLGRVDNAGTPLLVKWLDREIRFAKVDPANCASITLPSGLTLPTAASLANPADPASSIYIGTKPVVTDAPRVIGGVVEY